MIVVTYTFDVLFKIAAARAAAKAGAWMEHARDPSGAVQIATKLAAIHSGMLFLSQVLTLARLNFASQLFLSLTLNSLSIAAVTAAKAAEYLPEGGMQHNVLR